MALAQVNAIVRGYLSGWGVQYGEHEDGGAYRVLHGSTGVYIDFYEHGPHTVVRFKAIVLHDISEDSPIGVLPMINGGLPFVNFCFYPDEKLVTLEYELIGESMDEAEFRNALAALASIADGWDDRLQQEFGFGGSRHTEDGDERDL